ncbi:MAG: helix-hairpin-helix domain-containing protein [Bacteroidales bacterium]|jgi:hypothetical protein|nr:helix-hairpin-helix domain-containing protein [Bacteroidales bacterium]
MNFKGITLIFCILTIFLLFSLKANSQEDLIFNIEEIIEEIASSSDEELDYSELYSTLEMLHNDPINLNTTTSDELKQLIFLTEFQIYSLVNYRKKYGNYNSIYELQFVDGIDIETLKHLIPFVIVEEATTSKIPDLKKMFTYGKHTIITRYQQQLQKKAGYKVSEEEIAKNPDKSRYLGDPSKIYFKYNYQYKTNLSFGITAEKDDGEQFFKGAQKYGFDLYSAHFQINDIGVLNKLIIGDFSTQFGQGLTLWSGMSFGKTSNVINIIKKGRGINKYTSVNESMFFRGEAATFKFGDFKITEFVSYKKLDAGVEHLSDTISGEEEDIISAFLETGYHRTPAEIAKMNNVGEFVSGGNVSWASSILRLGLTGVYSKYSSNMVSSSALYKINDFSGNSNFNGGLDYLISLKQVNIFGETSMSQNLGWATLNGAVIDFVPEFKMSVLQRYFSSDYQAIYSAPFSEGNKCNNESGIFVGAEIYPIKKWKIDLYVDAFKFQWLKFGVNAPSKGMEYAVQLNYFTRRDLDMNVKVKYETKEKNNSDGAIHQINPYSTTKIRYHINYLPTDVIKLKNRIEISNYHIDKTNKWGYMIYQDVQYKPKKIPLTFTLHFAVFDTKDYDTRIYCYEPDVLYGFTVPAYYGKGERIAFVIKYQITQKLNFWFRIANTFSNDKESIGSGLDAINGNNKTDIKLELKYTF